jgi:hypothetical protein
MGGVIETELITVSGEGVSERQDPGLLTWLLAWAPLLPPAAASSD